MNAVNILRPDMESFEERFERHQRRLREEVQAHHREQAEMKSYSPPWPVERDYKSRTTPWSADFWGLTTGPDGERVWRHAKGRNRMNNDFTVDPVSSKSHRVFFLECKEPLANFMEKGDVLMAEYSKAHELARSGKAEILRELVLPRVRAMVLGDENLVGLLSDAELFRG